MSTHILRSAFSKVVATGIVVAACVGGTALPASAEPIDDASASQVARNKDSLYVGGVTFYVHDGVSLGPGVTTETRRMFLELRDKDNTPTEMVAKWNTTNALAAAAYPILRNGKKTNLYIKPQIETGEYSLARPKASCEVFSGMPGAGGAVVVDDPAFRCDVSQHWFSNDWDVDIKPTRR